MARSKSKRKPMHAALRRRKASAVPSKRRLPPIVDYSDAVTDEHFKRICELVDEDQFTDSEQVGDKGW
jgi:hypothetical protein